MLQAAREYGRLLSGLRGFLGRPTSLTAAVEQYRRQVDEREQAFLSLLAGAVFRNPRSPYRALFGQARADLSDVAASVARRGVEATLGALLDAGVCVTMEEFKGRRAIAREDFSLAVTPASFDNPLSRAAFVGGAGGSTGPARRLAFDFDQLDDDVPCHALFLEALGIPDHELVLWRPVPPGVAGIRRALIHARLGRPVAAWFS